MKKTLAKLSAFIIMFAIASLLILPVANAHDPPWEIQTYAYLSAAPNPIGLGQRLFIVMWLDAVLPGATVENQVRFHNFKLTITKPDGAIETQEWPVITDTASSQPYLYYPDQVGIYSFQWEYFGQVYNWNQANTPGLSAANAAYENNTYLPSKSKLVTVTVQQDPVPEPLSSYPLPTEYWTRPIEGQNTDWWTVSSNWLGRQSPQLAELTFRNQFDGVGPTTPHIMWTRPIQDGGVVGGTNTYVDGQMYYPGLTYNRRFNNPIIIHGRLYYTEPLSIQYTTTDSAGPTVAVDLRTGETLWSQTIPGPSNIFQFGYVYTSGRNPNMHGTWPSILFTANFARAYDARTGAWLFNVTNMPVNRAISPTTSVGTEAMGDDGTIYLYQMNAANRWLAQWNSSKLWNWGTTPTIPQVVDASLPSRYDWNITVPELRPGSAIIYTILDEMILIRNGTLPTPAVNNPYTIFALSLKPETRGQILWMQNYDPPAVTRAFPGKLVDEVNRVFMGYDKETSQLHGFSLENGNYLWTAVLPEDSSDFILYSYLGSIGLATAYGKVYFGGYGGILHTYDTKDGQLLWTYGGGGPGNTTYSGTALAYGRYPIYPGPIANGVIYLDTGEHSAQTPLYKGALIRALNATTGEKIWTLSGWGGHHRREGMAVADGYLVYLNHYDYQIYSIGRGPSATTITGPPDIQAFGKSMLIQGTVMDISAGTKQKEQTARFPNGIPAVSDANMSAWMEYVYMQKPRPKYEEILGVNVNLRVLDPNGNVYDIGTVTSDANGAYSLMWEPPVPGKYIAIASFDGTDAYWPSYAQTAFGVMDEPEPTSQPVPVSASNTELYFIPSVIAILIAIILATIVIVLMLKKRP